MSDSALNQKVSTILRMVPEGHVVSYGLLADLCGLPGRARLMGKCLTTITTPIAWHRVVRSDGKIAFPPGSEKANEQREKLVLEGVVVTNFKVNMKRYLWQPDFYTGLVKMPY